MSLDPVLSLRKSIAVVGCEEVLLKIFDLEHFGVLIQATVTSALTTGTPTEYTLGVTERQLIESGLSKSIDDLYELLQTMNFERFDSQFILYSEHPLIPRPKKTYTSKHIEKIIKDPSQSSTSLHDVLLDGLVELCKVKPVGNDAIKWLGEWLLANNPNTPKVEVATI